jgi:hypothetical protein
VNLAGFLYFLRTVCCEGHRFLQESPTSLQVRKIPLRIFAHLLQPIRQRHDRRAPRALAAGADVAAMGRRRVVECG